MEFQREQGRVFAQDPQGKLLAEVTFPTGTDGVAEIDHTFVDESLRGQGIASQLLEAAMEEISKRGQHVRPACSYAVKWLEQHPQYRELMDETR